MNFIHVRKLLLMVLSLFLTNLTGCAEVEVNTIIDQTPIASEGQERPEEVMCKVKLKLTCIAGLVCFRDLSVQKASQPLQIHTDTITLSGEESFAVSSCDLDTVKRSALSSKLDLVGKVASMNGAIVKKGSEEETK